MPRDRTPEFRATLSSIRSRSSKYNSSPSVSGYSLNPNSNSNHNEAKQRLLPGGPSLTGVDAKGNGNGKGKGRDLNGSAGAGGSGGGAGGGKTEFTRMAGQISRDLAATTGKLGKLAQRESYKYFVFGLEWISLGGREGWGWEGEG